MMRIVMRTPEHDIYMELNDSETSRAIYEVLPIDEYINVWGEEIYFPVPVKHKLENGKKIMEVGEIAYWPEGEAFCIFFGPTPVSKGPLPEAYSPVTPLGRVVSDIAPLKELGDRTRIFLERA
ncbi:MAG: cyclophilin-like fold protein [Methanomassiliicoccales archaeon]